MLTGRVVGALGNPGLSVLPHGDFVGDPLMIDQQVVKVETIRAVYSRSGSYYLYDLLHCHSGVSNEGFPCTRMLVKMVSGRTGL